MFCKEIKLYSCKQFQFLLNTIYVYSCSFTQFVTEHKCAHTHAGSVYMYTFSVPHEHKFTLEMCLLNLQVWCRCVPLPMYDRVKISYNSPLSKISTDATEITQAGLK